MRGPFSIKVLGVRGERIEPPAADASVVDKWLERGVWIGLGAAALAAAIFLGGLHPRGQTALAIATFGAAVALVALAWRRGPSSIWTVTPVHIAALAALLLVAVQLAPLPAAVLRGCSPSLAKLLPLWTGAGEEPASFPRWNTISLSPSRTRASLAMLAAYALFFAVTFQMARSLDGVERVLRRLAVVAVIVAAVGLAQFGLGDASFLGLYEYSPTSAPGVVRGPFLDPRHFAYFLALGVGPLVWLMQRSLAAHRDARRAAGAKAVREAATTGWRLWWRLVALGLVVVAAWMTRSPLGLATLLLTLLASGALLWRAKLFERQALTMLGGAALLLFCAALARGPAPTAASSPGDMGSYSAKYGVGSERGGCWNNDCRELRDFWPLGVGADCLRDIAPCYCAELHWSERPRAVNDYVEAAIEAGLPGFLLLAFGVVWLATSCYRAVRSPTAPTRLQSCLAAVVPGLAASAIVAGFDGVWRLPACLTMTAMLAACALRLAQFALPSSPRFWRLELGRGYLVVAGVALVLLGGWVIEQRGRASLAATHWIAFMQAAVADVDARAKVSDDTVANHLERVLYWTPDNAQAHLKLATAILAEGSRTTSGNGAALEHARRAVELCPLAGEGYLALAELDRRAALCDAPPASALVEQALRVRPHDCQVLVVAGREALAAGDLPGALDHWRKVYDYGNLEQTRLIDALVGGRVPVDVILTEFKPDLNAIRLLDAKYSPTLSAEEAKPMLDYYLEIATAATVGLHEDRAAALWAEMEGLHERLGQHAEAMHCLRRAAAGRPDDCELRAMLADRLLGDGLAAEAEMHIKWCLQHQPDDSKLHKLLAEARGRQEREGAAARHRTYR